MSIQLTRRHFSQAVIGATAVGLLTACGGPGGKPDANGVTTLRFAWWGNADRAAATQKVLDKFEAANPRIKIKGEPSDFSGYFDKLATGVAAKDAPDVFTLGGAYPAEYANRGALLDLAKVTPTLDLSKMDKSALTNGQVNGTQYGISTGANALAVVVNPAVFKAAGVQLPDNSNWTWEDFRTLAAKITGSGPAGTYGSATVLTHDSLDAFARQRGESLYTQDGKLGLTDSTAVDYFSFSLSLSQTKASPTPSQMVEQASISTEQSLMGTGKAAMMLTWSNSLRALAEAAGTKLELLALPGESPTPGIWLQSSQYFAISAQSNKTEAAAKLVNFLINDEDAAKIMLTDRGVPSNSSVRAAIAPALSESGQAEVTYLDLVGKTKFAPSYIGPKGSTSVSEITARINTNVLFQKVSPADGAKQWMSETAAAISA
jgi:multiple sugar transport system substrate-binding protein